MPQVRKSSPRRRDRRSRSRSRSPRDRRHSSSRSRDRRSRSKERRRSRSPQRKRSPERRHRSPPRKRSPSPKRRGRSKSRSRSPPRKSRHSSSPERGYPVKRPADSSGKRSGYRSRSPSPVQKRSRDERVFKEESPRESRRSKRSQSPSTSYGGRMYSDQASSSKQPIFPAGSSSKKHEIDYVTIVEKGPKREKLDKRFETLEQVAQGAFDFEENITIGIHRGPQHIQLHDDEDIEVNYEFNPKTFKMLFPKKEYPKAIFDRDEIKAFHHDDVLDEEPYVEKRTISIKPVDKPKSRKYGDDLDYKITVGSDREGYGDRRMVHDSGSRSRPSRSSRYDDIPVTVRLDPKPDPRYEKIYKEQQRNEDESLMNERIKRNPNDLRHNLLRRKSDGDRGDRGDRGDHSRDGSRRDDGRRDSHTVQDARSRIQARREGFSDGRRDRSAPERSGPERGRSPKHEEKKKRSLQMSLPDFKNRPEKLKPEPEWKLNPTVTPKGQSYYEHDNRSREDMSFADRRRFSRGGRFRGRGRGVFREPRGRGLPKRSFGGENSDVWKHDKFDEIENNDNEQSNDDNTETKTDVKADDNSDRRVGSQMIRRVSDSNRDRTDSHRDRSNRKESSSSRKESSSSRKESLSSRKEFSSTRKESSSTRKESSGTRKESSSSRKESSSREKRRSDDKGSSRDKKRDDHKESSSSEKRKDEQKVSSSGEKSTNDQKESTDRSKSHEAIEKEKMDIKKEEENLKLEVQVEVT